LCIDVSPNGLSLIFVSARSGGYGGNIGDLWLTKRPTLSDPWGPSVNLGPIVNGSSNENGPCLSGDSSMLYFSSDRAGGFGAADMWQVSINPVVDLNSDGIVDADDMCIIVDNWGTDNSLCDIGPMPWGDGVVDVEDLKVLAEHLFEDSRLIAHWKLDEIGGIVANDSIGNNVANLFGDPVWQPDGGVVNGCLAFDGIDDYVSTPSILDPRLEPFSMFAWIKGDLNEYQVIISEKSTGNLLAVDTKGFVIMSAWSSDYGEFIYSDEKITFGQWHHVGLLWDGNIKSMYLDGIEVAQTTVTDEPAAGVHGNTGFTIGASWSSKTNFFSGLIDDVRIYNQALSAEEIAVLAQ